MNKLLSIVQQVKLGSDHPILQEEVSMVKTISLTIYKVMKLYDGHEDI